MWNYSPLATSLTQIETSSCRDDDVSQAGPPSLAQRLARMSMAWRPLVEAGRCLSAGCDAAAYAWPASAVLLLETE